MFGYAIPQNYKKALKLNKMNGNTKWEDNNTLKMLQLDKY